MIRQALPQDAEAIAKVHVASWQAAYKGLMPEDFLANLTVEWRKTQWQQWLEQNEQVMMVCEVNRQIIGFASAGQPGDQDLSSDTAALTTLYLLADFWGKGFGK